MLEGLGCAAFDGEFVAGGPAEPAVLPAVGAPVLLDGASGEAGAGAWRPVDLPVLEDLGRTTPEFHLVIDGEAEDALFVLDVCVFPEDSAFDGVCAGAV